MVKLIQLLFFIVKVVLIECDFFLIPGFVSVNVQSEFIVRRDLWSLRMFFLYRSIFTDTNEELNKIKQNLSSVYLVYIYMNILRCLHVYTHTRSHTHTHTYKYIHTYSFIQIYLYIYIYIWDFSLLLFLLGNLFNTFVDIYFLCICRIS